MARLHIFTVHIKPRIAEPYEHAEFVKEGFSWPAFFFGVFWLAYKRLWVPAAIALLAAAVIGFLEHEHALEASSIALLQFGMMLVIGMHANDWLLSRLKRSGFIIADIVSGENINRAEQRFFDRFAASSGILQPSFLTPIS